MVRYNIDFTRALSNPELSANFHEYLRRSYTREPFEFLLAVDKDFKLQLDPKAKVQSAKNIVSTFICDDCKLELNIDSHNRKNMVDAVETLTPESENLETLFDELYRLIFIELKSDSFVRYLDSEMFLNFVKEKGEHIVHDLCSEKTVRDPIVFSPFNVRGNIKDLDIVNLIRMGEDFTDWTALQKTKMNGTENPYYSYVSTCKYPLDEKSPAVKAGKFCGLLPCSAEEALYAVVDPVYTPQFDQKLLSYKKELEPYTDGDYDQSRMYAELDLLSILQTRYSAGNNTILYDSVRRMYILINKTETEFDNSSCKQKKSLTPGVFVGVHLIYKISETKCRYVTIAIAYVGVKEPGDAVYKHLLKRRGKNLFQNWLKYALDRKEKYGSTRPQNCPELDTLDSFMAKYLPTSESIKTWLT